MKVLIIDDDLELCNALKGILAVESNKIDFAHDGETGALLACKNHYDIIILDQNLPKQNGHSVCTKIRDTGKTTPILILTINTDFENKINLLEDGADDYLTKPFLSRELLTRLRVLVRRSHYKPEPIKIGPLVIDTTKQIVWCKRRIINLPQKQYLLLEYLAKHVGQIVTRATIMEKVWELNSNVWSNTFEAHLCELRKQLQAVSGKKFIHTVPGRGYKLIVPT